MKPNVYLQCILCVAVLILFSAFYKKGEAKGSGVPGAKLLKKDHYTPVSKDTAQAMLDAYSKMKLGILSGKDTVRGFQLDSNDFSNIKANIQHYKTISLFLGVQNYAAATAGTASPVYTLVVVPVNMDGTEDLNNIDEYVFPCPPYCQPPGLILR